MGPIKSNRNVRTSRKFYNSYLDQDGQSPDYVVNVQMGADGAKVIDVEMKGLKLYIRVDILYTLSNFFLYNFPVYTSDTQDKPTFFEPDYGNHARMEVVLNLNDCLLCFE